MKGPPEIPSAAWSTVWKQLFVHCSHLTAEKSEEHNKSTWWEAEDEFVSGHTAPHPQPAGRPDTWQETAVPLEDKSDVPHLAPFSWYMWQCHRKIKGSYHLNFITCKTTNYIESLHFMEIKARSLCRSTDLPSPVRGPWPLWPPLPLPTCSLCCGPPWPSRDPLTCCRVPSTGSLRRGYQHGPLPCAFPGA